MKTEITSKDYKDIYEACGWDSKAFSLVLKRFGYSDELIVNDDLKLTYSPIKSLVNIKEVRGVLDLEGTSIQDLGKLEKVGSYLDLRETPIQDLGNLREVGEFLNLERTPIQDLGNLRKVGSNLWLGNTPISKKYSEEEIRRMVEVRGNIWLK